MEDNLQEKQDDALVMISLRNEFYRKKYHFVLAVFFLSLIVVGVLIGMLMYLIKHPPQPYYFAADKAGRFIQEIPVTQPNMSTQEVAAWAVDAVESTYTYDYVNYRQQLQNAQKYFTEFGWRSYMKGLEDSLNLVALSKRQLMIIAKVVSPPKLIIEGPLGKSAIYAYKFDVQVLVTYYRPPYDDKSKFENPLDVNVIIERQDSLSSYKGLGIVQIIGSIPQAG